MMGGPFYTSVPSGRVGLSKVTKTPDTHARTHTHTVYATLNRLSKCAYDAMSVSDLLKCRDLIWFSRVSVTRNYKLCMN